MEVEQEMPSLENGDARHQEKQLEDEEEEEEEEQQAAEENANVLQFMDSMDACMTLIHSLSATLRQGWLELSTARHSMGASRVNTVLLDHKFHRAATSLIVTQDDGKEEKTSSENKASLEVGDQVQKERCKSLSVFGTLVSPKLRASQLSFETALETLVEIANMRSAMLCANKKVHKKLGGSSMG